MKTAHIFFSLEKRESVVVYLCCAQKVMSNSANPWTVAHQAPLSMEVFRQECWSGLLFPAPGNVTDPGIIPASFASPVLAGRFLTLVPPGKPYFNH